MRPVTRVYFAEDSPTVARVLQSLLEGAPDLASVGVGVDGLQARADLERLRPDILVTDLNMPGMDGFQLIQWVMENQPMPIVVLSDALDAGDREMAMKCLGMGAMEARAKPRAGSPAELSESREAFQGLLRALKHVKPISRRPAFGARTTAPLVLPRSCSPDLIAIGASTGGPPVILSLLKALGKGFPLPILLSIHMEKGFMHDFGNSLSRSTAWPVKFGAVGEFPRPGVLYLPEDGQHLILDSLGRMGSVAPLAEERLVPSVDRLFHSLAEHAGRRTCALLLTGMGRDGAEGLKAIREAGGLTFAQDENSCVVYGMPKAAADLGAAQAMMSPQEMATALKHIASPRERSAP